MFRTGVVHDIDRVRKFATVDVDFIEQPDRQFDVASCGNRLGKDTGRFDGVSLRFFELRRCRDRFTDGVGQFRFRRQLVAFVAARVLGRRL